MENGNNKGNTSKPQSETNALVGKGETQTQATTSFGTMETSIEEAIIVTNKKNAEITNKGDGKEEDAKDEVQPNMRMSEEERGGEEVEGNSTKKKKVDKRKKVSKKIAPVDSSAKATKKADKPESSKKVDSGGMIFMCSSKTKKDCYRYKVLGLPANKKEVVRKIYKGMRLFLFDFDLRLMYGIYKATRPGGYNIEPKAFKSAFPSQVRFTVLEDCLPLAEEKFKKVIKDNYYRKNKFNCELNSDQVKNLCKLFQAASKGSKSKVSGRSLREEARPASDWRRRTRKGWEDKRYPVSYGDSLYKEPPLYEREVYASPLASRPLHGPLPPPVAAIPSPSYVYRRPVETELYRREPLLGSYERAHLDLEMRWQDDIQYRDPHVPNREPPFSHDLMYSGRHSSGHNRRAAIQTEYYPPAGLSTEHHAPAGLRSEYYPPASLSSEHHPPASHRAKHYTLSGPLSDYHSAGRQLEYRHLRSSYRL